MEIKIIDISKGRDKKLMLDLYLQTRILYYLYENYNRGQSLMLQQSLYDEDYLQTQKVFKPIIFRRELGFLKEKGYVESTQQRQQQLWKISATGIEKIEELFKNFAGYIKEHKIQDSDYYDNHFNAFKPISERINKIFFKIHRETILQNAFEDYLKSKNSI